MSRPGATPETRPVVEPTTATVVLLLDHRPPRGVEVNVSMEFAHITLSPTIGVGTGNTDTKCVVRHPVASVYTNVSLPAERPLKSPAALIEPIAGFVLVHTPPDVASVRNMFDPTQTIPRPEILAGSGFTVICLVEEQPVPRR